MKVYCIENLLDGRKYVGVTKATIEHRYKAHKRLSRTPNSKNHMHIHSAMLKYGIDNFIVYEIDSAQTKEELFEKEKQWIIKLDTKANGYNETDGGEGCFGWKATPEQVEANRQRNIERIKDPVYRAFIFEKTQEGIRNISKEAKQRMVDAAKRNQKGNQHAKGKRWKLSEENKRNMSEAKKGVPKSDAMKQKLSVLRQGEGNPSYGSIWITDGNINKKIKKTDTIPSGWIRGRNFSPHMKAGK